MILLFTPSLNLLQGAKCPVNPPVTTILLQTVSVNIEGQFVLNKKKHFRILLHCFLFLCHEIFVTDVKQYGRCFNFFSRWKLLPFKFSVKHQVTSRDKLCNFFLGKTLLQTYQNIYFFIQICHIIYFDKVNPLAILFYNCMIF